MNFKSALTKIILKVLKEEKCANGEHCAKVAFIEPNEELLDHGLLLGLPDNDHPQYTLRAQRNITYWIRTQAEGGGTQVINLGWQPTIVIVHARSLAGNAISWGFDQGVGVLHYCLYIAVPFATGSQTAFSFYLFLGAGVVWRGTVTMNANGYTVNFAMFGAPGSMGIQILAIG